MSEKKYPTLIDGIKVSETYQKHIEIILKEINTTIRKYCETNRPVGANCVIESLIQNLCMNAVYNDFSLSDLLKATTLVYGYHKNLKKAHENKEN